MNRRFAAVVLVFAVNLRPAAAGAETLAASASRWPTFRGDGGLSGSSPSRLPGKPVLRWSFDTGAPVTSSPVVGDGKAYIGSLDGKLYCVDLASGRKLWESDTGSPVGAPPVLDGDAVYVGNLAGSLLRLDASTGRRVWEFTAEGRFAGSANVLRRGAGAATVLAGSYDGNLYALDAGSGRLLWAFPTESYINGTPAVAGNLAVFGGCDAQLHIVSALDGRETAAVDTGAYVPGSPAVVGGRAYVGNYGDLLVCVDLGTRKILWEYRNDREGGAFFSSPAANGEAVVIGSRDGRVHCVDARSGLRRWAVQAGTTVDSSPVIAGDAAVFGTADGRLTIVALKDGAERWSYEVGDALSGSPAVAGGMLLAGCEDGRLYAFSD